MDVLPGNFNPQQERKNNILTIQHHIFFRYHVFKYIETRSWRPLERLVLQTKKNPQNLYYVCARGEHTSSPKPLISARTFNVIGSLRSQHRPNTLGTPKIKRSMPKAIYKSLKPIFKRYFNLFICTCNDYCSFNIKKSVLFSSNGNHLWQAQLLQCLNIYMYIYF